MKKIVIYCLIILFLPVLVSAASFVSGEKYTSSTSLTDNLYVAAANILINDDIVGDFFGVGSSIAISSDISEDVFVVSAGGTQLLGNTLGDVRVVGSEVLVSGNVSGELLVIGGVVRILPEANIQGDVFILGEDVFVSGSVNGDIKILGKNIEISSQAKGNVSPRVGIQSEIMVSPSLDLVIKGEYVLSSINLDNKWTYSDDDDESSSLAAHWDGPEPEINYSGIVLTFGIRSVFFQ